MPVQVKARTELTPAGQVHITVTATSLVDDQALVVAALVDGEQLGPFILVIDEAAFRDRAVHNVVNGREYLTAAFQLHSGGDSRWAQYLVAREELAERFGAVAPAVAVPVEDVLSRAVVDRGHEGFLGEMEVVRRLAEAESLNLFRPFPDLETVEVLARHVSTRRFLGIQVKTVGWDQDHLELSLLSFDIYLCAGVESRFKPVRRRLPFHPERGAAGHREGGRRVDDAGAGARRDAASTDGSVPQVAGLFGPNGGIDAGVRDNLKG
jgi:hypothetical protein